MLKRLSFIPLPLIIATAVIIYIVDIRTIYEPHLLLQMLNTIFIGGGDFTIAFIVASAYVFGAKRQALFLGGGVLALGISALLGGWIFPESLNASVTISTIGFLLAALLHLLGATQSTKKYPARYSLKKFPRQSIAILFYSGIAIFFVILSAAAIRGLFPPFFVAGEGYTLTRWVITIAYLILFFTSALLYTRLYYSSRESFLYWYSLGLAIIAVGLTLAPLGIPGDPLNWLGRIAQYLGSIYFLVAAVSTLKEARAKGIGLAQKMGNIWREPAISYRMLVSMARDAIISIDEEGKVLVWSPAAERLFGYSQNEATGSLFASLVAADEQADSLMIQLDHSNDIDNDLADKNRVELELRKKNGETFAAELSVSVGDTPSGRLRMAVIRDITERKQVEKEIEHLASFPQLNPSPVIEIDANGTVTYSNAATAEVLKTLKMENDMRIFLPGDFEEIMKALEQKKEGQLFYRDVEVKDRIFAESIHVITKLSVVRIYIHDTTERKRAEKALRESEQRFRLLVAGVKDYAIYMIDPNGYIVNWNEGAKNIKGYEAEEIVGKHFSMFYTREDVEAGKPDHELEVALSEGRYEDEGLRVRKDGSIFSASVIISPIMDGDGNLIGFTKIVRDITERKKMENALRESEQRYATTLASIGDAVISTDVEGQIIFMNAEAEALTGWALAEASTKPVTEVFNIINEYTRREADNPVTRVLQEGIVVGLANHTILVRKDGTEVPIDDSGAPIRDGGGKSMGVVLVFRDITERKRAEEELKESEEKYRGLFNWMGEAIQLCELVFDEEGRPVDNIILDVNPAYEKQSGLRREQVVGRRIKEILPIVEQAWLDRYGEVVRTGTTMHFEEYSASLDKWFEVYANPMSGNRFTAVFTDITERKRAEEALRKAHDELDARVQERTAELSEANKKLLAEIGERKQAEEKIREQATLLDNAQEAVGVRSLEHRLIYWNKGAQRLYGWTAEEAIGKNPVEFLFKDKEEPPQLIESKRVVLEKGEWKGELHEVTKDGREVIVESHWTLICDSEGKPKSILVVNTDITEKKMFEAHLLRAQRMESIGILAGGIAHNLNNMLTPMMMSLHMLKKKFKDEQSQKLLTILEKDSQRGADLIKQVLSFSRGVEGERIPLQVAHIIAEIEKIAKETFPRNIEIRTDIQKDLFTISGDATQLHQVIMNLCVNARDAMPDGGTLSISAENFSIDETYARMHTEAKVGSYVVIVVSDTGIGIPPKILDRIFEPFFTTKEFGKGTGLGLSTALAIVKSHGGFINVYSEVGKGTKFRVYLPAIKTEIQNVEEQQLELLTGNGELVLVAEDEDSVREVTVSTLEKYGYNVLAANDGADAVTLFAQNKGKVEVILMDLMMPIMDGHASIRAIRKINPEVKIIAVSGLAEKDRLAKVADYTNAFLPKPYTAEKLLKTIHEVLSAK